jgi:hypothetical protein
MRSIDSEKAMSDPLIPVSAAEHTRRREAIRGLNAAYWIAAREAALSDPVYAALAYGLPEETIDQIVGLSVPDLLARIQQMAVTSFQPVGRRVPGAIGEVEGLHAALTAMTGGRRTI